ncbi:hypothetical protein [Kribbella sp. CA-294648]|uniref:hypothetical protein n=1 Tax=Kribbella sp. CA-294648 TaxID=3239948 RepID=UPI003D9471BD
MEGRTPPKPRSLMKDAEGHWVRRWTGAEWFEPADAWVRSQLAATGIAVTGDPVPYKIRFWAAVWCYPTDHGLYWFKENNPGQSFEAALVQAMARELPQHVIPPHAIEPTRGWLLTADQGATLGDQPTQVEPLVLWRRLVIEYAGLQRDTIPAEQALLASGLTAIGPDRLGDTVHGIADWFAQLDSDHPLAMGAKAGDHPGEANDTPKATGDTIGELHRAADNLASWGSRFSGAIPLALDQNDLHAYNVFAAGTTAPFRFFDFGDALWAHPFVTLSCVRGALVDPDDPDSWAADDPRLAEITDAYLGQWTDLAPLDVLRTELQAALPLHVVHRLVSWHRLLVHADETEAAAWAFPPRHWVAEVIRLFAV